MERIIIIVLATFFTTVSIAQEKITLWEKGKIPNSKGLSITDSISNERVHRIGTPYIEMFTPSIAENKKCAVLIIPGGGYVRLSHIISGTQIAKWFNTFGVTAFVLYHRLPTSPDLQQKEVAPLQDAQRAIRIIRSMANELQIDTSKIGVMGCSAGGHLSATLGTHTNDVSNVKDMYNAYSFKPNFMVLVSPVISLKDSPYLHKGSRINLLGNNPSNELIEKYSLETQVTEKTPPALLFHADNDKSVGSMNSIIFYSALKNNKVPASLHIFPYGGHSIALRNNPPSTQLWTELCELWMKEMKLIEE